VTRGVVWSFIAVAVIMAGIGIQLFRHVAREEHYRQAMQRVIAKNVELQDRLFRVCSQTDGQMTVAKMFQESDIESERRAGDVLVLSYRGIVPVCARPPIPQESSATP